VGLLYCERLSNRMNVFKCCLEKTVVEQNVNKVSVARLSYYIFSDSFSDVKL